MTPEKMKQAFEQCLYALKQQYPDLSAVELPEHMKASKRTTSQVTGFHPHDGIRHLMFMCLAGCGFVDAGRLDKANRWLGFLQGAIWMGGFNSIVEMKDWNRPDGPADWSIPSDATVASIREAEDARILKVLSLERTPDGHINNCALANGDSEENCQMCDGQCPDRSRFG